MRTQFQDGLAYHTDQRNRNEWLRETLMKGSGKGGIGLWYRPREKGYEKTENVFVTWKGW